ncbi:unnamed protein product [Zymoseptoria tritici ST99CH_1A5]|uniref:Uncharacterized protein n=2 Tax=Zymoseptoria tritici TaxID=1047171 RepID=A0A2H1HA10_ZYMTR|nr:unnamed protein product [Zymoseptoria tritici ST99CH_1E4]SMY30579.1 unnamed protein product [Zymoseptoria tritici ST99CH_1A5]
MPTHHRRQGPHQNTSSIYWRPSRAVSEAIPAGKVQKLELEDLVEAEPSQTNHADGSQDVQAARRDGKCKRRKVDAESEEESVEYSEDGNMLEKAQEDESQELELQQHAYGQPQGLAQDRKIILSGPGDMARIPERSESSPFIVLTNTTAKPHHTAADTQKSLKRDMSDSPTTNVSPSDV